MQRKCHRCDKLYTPVDHHTWCQDCRDGKPVKPRKTIAQLQVEREQEMERAYKYKKTCLYCGKEFYTNQNRKVICGDFECEEARRRDVTAEWKKKKREERKVLK